MKKRSRNDMRIVRHDRLRRTLSGTSAKPRFNVFRSLKNLYIQVIDDQTGNTLVSASTLEKGIKEQLKGTCNIEAAKLLGKVAAQRSKAKGINTVVFDRGGHAYHGKVAAIADAARAEGLVF